MGEERKNHQYVTPLVPQRQLGRVMRWMRWPFLDLLTLWPSLILITVDLYSYQLGLSSAEFCVLVNGVSQILHWYKICDLSQHIPSS